MFREHLSLIQEAVVEGSNRGIESFLETLNQDLNVEEVIEESGGIDNAMKQLFTENGYSVTELKNDEEVLEEDIDKKLDSILESLKKEGLVD
jgi:hypothetical protein